LYRSLGPNGNGMSGLYQGADNVAIQDGSDEDKEEEEEEEEEEEDV